jgi:hypothetical protein
MKSNSLRILFIIFCAVPQFATAKLFTNETANLGLPTDFAANQTVVADLNLDGYDDLILTEWHIDPITTRVFINDDGRKFVEYTVEGFQAESQAVLKMARGLFGTSDWGVIVRYPKRPLQGFAVAVNKVAKKIIFTPVQSDVLPKVVSNWGDVQLFDHDQDGQLDFLATSFYDGRTEYSAGPLYIFKGVKSEGRNIFADISDKVGLRGLELLPTDSHEATVPTYMANVCDMDNDGKLDLLIAGYGRRWNKLMFNRGGIYKNLAESLKFDADDVGKADFRGNGNSFTASCGDVNRDGKLDVFQGEITHEWAGPESDISSLLVNQYPQPFNRLTNFQRASTFDNQGDIGSAFGDLDLNGTLDLVIANSDYPPETKMLVLSNQDDLSFKNISDELSEEIINPKGVVLFDFDHDGDLDMIMGENAMRGHTPAVKFFKNMTQENLAVKKRFISLVLEGDGITVPLSPVGARGSIKAKLNQVLVREAVFGGGQDAQSPLTLHFPLEGLVNSKKVVVDLKWNQMNSEKLKLNVNKTYLIKYKNGKSIVTELK